MNRSGKRFPALVRQPDALGCIDEIADLSEYAEYLAAERIRTLSERLGLSCETSL